VVFQGGDRDQASESFVERRRRLIGPFASDHGSAVESGDDRADSCRAWVGGCRALLSL
jgi:hypothetical protein